MCSVKGLKSGTKYVFTVRAVNSVSVSTAAKITVTMPGEGQDYISKLCTVMV